MNRRIIRGVRVAAPGGIGPASVHIADGLIVAVAGYDEIPREAAPEELGKSVLMPGLLATTDEPDGSAQTRADKLLLHLSEVWTKMREQGQPIESIVDLLCQGQIAVGFEANFVVWHPALTVIGSKPALYGQVRQTIVSGQCVYKNGVHLVSPSS